MEKISAPSPGRISASLLIVLLMLMSTDAAAQVWEEWVALYSRQSSENYGVDIAVDVDGNVFVTGQDYENQLFTNYGTVKYDADGILLWEAIYVGPAEDDDFVEAIAVDTQGDVIVTGWSLGVGSHFDFATVKYSADGTEEWVARYDGPPSDYDYAHALTVDGDDNIYVTGSSVGAGGNDDFGTIKYDAGGAELWVARYDNPENGHETPHAIAVDNAGNVYVTGRSALQPGYPSQSCFTTIKYNSAGVEQWVREYSSTETGYNIAIGVVIDGLGDIYVTGAGGDFDTFPYDYDMHTIKYSSAGVEQWVAGYGGTNGGWDFPRALGVDSASNVYVLGQSEGTSGHGYATIKYDTIGQEQWVARYDPMGNSANPRDLALDLAGNIYVTGSSNYDYKTIKYDPAGVQKWIASYSGPDESWDNAVALATDMLGYVYVTGTSKTSFATIKYGHDDIVAIHRDTWDLSASGGEVLIRWHRSTASEIIHYRLVRLHEGLEVELRAVSPVPGQFEVVDSDPLLLQGGSFCYKLFGQRGDLSWQLLHSETLELEPLARTIVLNPAQPNPFNPQTLVSFSLSRGSQVRVTVHDLKGHRVTTLHEGYLDSGEHTLEWKGLTAQGRPVDSGIYFVRLEAPGVNRSQKVVLVR